MSRRTGIVAVIAATLATGLTAPPAVGAEQPTPDVSAEPVQVTLITGDRVAVRTVGDRTSLRVTPAPRGRPVPFQDFTRRGDRYLLPADAATLVRAGRLDVELFNVTGLIRQGYDDAHTPDVPLLMRQSGASKREGVRRVLPGLDMTAVDEKKSGTAAFWNSLVQRKTVATGGVEKIWLNAKMHANLDRSVPQIGAPAAWQSGLTGSGVRVAVLDSGIDTDHPDLVGKVAQSKDFSGTGTVEDDNGHGTHVASTITGSGAASRGLYKGVAPDATLAVGKVLDNTGSGGMDVILAGMEWAAADVRAKVVTMSLGGGPSDGTDPVSEAVNTLTRRYGTLFVVAAGNFGGDETVASPAAADEALAVGSVSKQDEPSPFSSRGPRGGDGALKPEIAAPGDSIVAARPAGVEPRGEPVGEAYQRLSGTSMATPHVAGSAAILAQQHPDWAADRLKAALVSSATEVAAGPFAVGTGRVDVARATKATVIATGSASTFLPWPDKGQQKRQTVTWQNTGSAPVTLDLGANLTGQDGQPAPAGLLTLSATSVTVPAGGSVPVELVVTAQDGRPGTYSGVLTARTADGAVTTRTALSVRQQEERYDLTVGLVDRDGETASAVPYQNVVIVDLDSGDVLQAEPGTYRLPRGRYSVQGIIETPRAGREPTLAAISQPELVLDHDVTQTLDARDGQPVSAEPDNPAARGGTQVIANYVKVRACACTFSLTLDFDPRFQQAFAATVPGTSSDSFAFGQERRATEPVLELATNDGRPFEVPAAWYNLVNGPADRATLPAVHGGTGTPEDLAKIDAKGKLVLIEPSADISHAEVAQRVAAIKNAGGKLVVLNLPREPYGEEKLVLPTIRSSGETLRRFVELVKTGGAKVSYVSRPFPNYRYELAYGVERQVSTPQVYRPKTRELAEVRTAYHDNVAGEVNYGAYRDFFGHSLGTGWTAPAAAGQERSEYFTPGNWDAFWSSAYRGLMDEKLELAAGRHYRVVWNKAAAGPVLRGLTVTHSGETPRPWAWREDGRFDMRLPLYGDAAGHTRVLDDFGTDTGSITLYRDGVAVPMPPPPTPAYADFPVPDQAAGYRLVAEARRTTDVWALSTSVMAEWTFRSSAADDGKALPLLTARFAPEVNLRNQAPGGWRFTLPVHVERQDGVARIRSLVVDVSYDDGRTWQPSVVKAEGDHWTAGVRHPASGYASLRASVTDTDGNTVRQTIIRAYQIGG